MIISSTRLDIRLYSFSRITVRDLFYFLDINLTIWLSFFDNSNFVCFTIYHLCSSLDTFRTSPITTKVIEVTKIVIKRVFKYLIELTKTSVKKTIITKHLLKQILRIHKATKIVELVKTKKTA